MGAVKFISLYSRGLHDSNQTRPEVYSQHLVPELPSAPGIKINMVSAVREAELHVGFLNLHQEGKDQWKTALSFP